MTRLQSRHHPNMSFSTQDLLAIDKTISQNYTPSSPVILPIERLRSRHAPQQALQTHELLAISTDITQRYAPHLPTRQSELTLVPVDPTSVYAYWNINSEQAGDLVLRVYATPASVRLMFDVPVSDLQNRQLIHLPSAGLSYAAVIAERDADNKLTILASADSISVPPLYPAPPKPTRTHTPQSHTKPTEVIRLDPAQKSTPIAIHAPYQAHHTDACFDYAEDAPAFFQQMTGSTNNRTRHCVFNISGLN